MRTHRQALLAHVTRTYHEESTNVSIVSVQRSAFPPHAGQAHSTHSRIVESGVPSAPVSFKLWLISGSTTGKSASGMGTSPHLLQVTIGIGVPQYRCREINQSRNLVTSIIMSHRNGARQHILDSRVQWQGEREIERTLVVIPKTPLRDGHSIPSSSTSYLNDRWNTAVPLLFCRTPLARRVLQSLWQPRQLREQVATSPK